MQGCRMRQASLASLPRLYIRLTQARGHAPHWEAIAGKTLRNRHEYRREYRLEFRYA